MNSIKESSINSSLIETKSIKGKQKPKTSIFDLILSKEFISKESLKSEKSAVDGKNLIDLDKKFRTKSEKNDKTLDNTSLPQIDFNSFEVSKNLELTKKALIKNILKIDTDKKSLTSNNVSLKNEIKTFQEKNKPQKILSQQEVKEPKHSELLNQVKVSEEPKTKKTLPQQAHKLTLSQLENFLDIKTESKNQNFNKLQNLEREDLVNNLNVNFSIENFKTIEKQDSNNNFNNKIIDQNTTKNNNFDSINGNNLTAINYDITSGYNSSKSSSDNQNNFTQNQSHTFQQNSFQNFNLTYQNTTINAIITQTTLNLFIKTSDIVFTPQMIDSIKNILETNGYKDLKLTLKDREKVYKLNSVEKNTQPITEKGINIAVWKNFFL